MKTYSYGNRNEKFNDVCIHVSEERKYVYVFRETAMHVWSAVGRILKSDYIIPADFHEANLLYFRLTD